MGYLKAGGSEPGSCQASPSGAGCADRWEALDTSCSMSTCPSTCGPVHRHFCPNPNATVVPTFDASGCDASPDCGHGACVVEGGGKHSCACDLGYSGPKCQ